MSNLSSVTAVLLTATLFACASDMESGEVADDGDTKTMGAELAATGDGLSGQYFDNLDFTAPVFTRVDSKVEFDWLKGSPDPRMGVDEFSVRWTGFVMPQYSQTYTFHTRADDGVRLWVDGKLVIDDWNRHSATELSGTISLVAGKVYAIKLEYFDAVSSASCSLSWSSPSRSKQIIPTARLFSQDPEPVLDPHAQLLTEVEGFATGVTGGKGAPTYWVTNLNDSGAGSLRAAATSSDPLWIRFQVSGTIALQSPLSVKADKTIDGRDQDVTITRNGFRIDGPSKNVIVTNLKFTSTVDDLIRVYDHASKVWIHRNDFSAGGDGAVDITEASTDVTVSWNHFFNHDKTMLIGADAGSTGDTVIRATLHHNYFDGTRQRHPLVRFGKVHAYNNYLRAYDNKGMYSGMTAQLLSEANVFEAGPSSDRAIMTEANEFNSAAGYAKSVGDHFNREQIVQIRYPERVFDWRTHYANAVVETANPTLAAKVAANAGWRQ